jgi:hypothetical protein
MHLHPPHSCYHISHSYFITTASGKNKQTNKRNNNICSFWDHNANLMHDMCFPGTLPRDNGRREGAGSRDGGKRIHEKLANWSWVSSGIVGSKISNRIYLKLVRIR